MKVNLTYFKKSGKYYSEGNYETSTADLGRIWDEVRAAMRAGDLPGLSPGATDFFVLINVPEHPHEHPKLVVPERWLITDHSSDLMTADDALAIIDEIHRRVAKHEWHANPVKWIQSFLTVTPPATKLVVFARSIVRQKRLMMDFDSPLAAFMTSMNTAHERLEALDRFQRNPECRLMVSGLPAPSADGMQWVSSDILILGYRPKGTADPEDPVIAQAIGRIERLGQTRQVNVHFIAED